MGEATVALTGFQRIILTTMGAKSIDLPIDISNLNWLQIGALAFAERAIVPLWFPNEPFFLF
jgi:hypothetical protein